MGDDLSDNHGNAVQAQMSRLRRALGAAGAANRIGTTSAGYALPAADDEIDTWRFDVTALYRTRRATEALDVYRGSTRRLAELGFEAGPELRGWCSPPAATRCTSAASGW